MKSSAYNFITDLKNINEPAFYEIFTIEKAKKVIEENKYDESKKTWRLSTVDVQNLKKSYEIKPKSIDNILPQASPKIKKNDFNTTSEKIRNARLCYFQRHTEKK